MHNKVKSECSHTASLPLRHQGSTNTVTLRTAIKGKKKLTHINSVLYLVFLFILRHRVFLYRSLGRPLVWLQRRDCNLALEKALYAGKI